MLSWNGRCFFCGNGSLFDVCNRAKCQEYDREYRSELNAVWRNEWWKALWCAVRRWCRDDQNFVLNWGQRVFYTLKAVACMFLGLHKDSRRHPLYGDQVEVALLDFSRHYGGWSIVSLEVGFGVFSNWFYEIVHDGDCTM